MWTCKSDDQKPITPNMQRHLEDYSPPGQPWGFIDAQGDIVIKARFDEVRSFTEGLAPVNEKGLWGYIDKAGKYVVQPQFLKAHNFDRGLARVRGADGLMGVINIQLDTVIAFQFDEIFPRLQEHFVVEKHGRKGLIDKRGQIVVETIYHDIKSPGPNLWALKESDRFVLIDFKQNTLLDEVKAVKQGGIVETDDGWGVLNSKGQWLIRPQTSQINLGHEGHFILKRDGKYGLFDVDSKSWIEMNGDNLKYLGESRYAAHMDEGWFLVDEMNNILNPVAFESIYDFSEEVGAFQLDGWWGYMTPSGQVLVGPIFALPWELSEGKQRLFTREGFGFHDKQGKVVIEPKFSDVRDFSDGMAAYQK
jgi:hypothetical protein